METGQVGGHSSEEAEREDTQEGLKLEGTTWKRSRKTFTNK